jgi:hypothetical protein
MGREGRKRARGGGEEGALGADVGEGFDQQGHAGLAGPACPLRLRHRGSLLRSRHRDDGDGVRRRGGGGPTNGVKTVK